ncbi:hypothetical protein [Cucumibacter marinus]|uniref:hypothetical protein n=1 Tax=Cucumibacter marinus TaxID=1121252 RepID=UPI0003F86CAA|nr:hypothetical protein [Cucumibacter marinus]
MRFRQLPALAVITALSLAAAPAFAQDEQAGVVSNSAGVTPRQEVEELAQSGALDGVHSLLIEEPDADAETRSAFVGNLEWTSFDDADGNPVISGAFDLPDRGISGTMRLSKNTDESLPARFIFNIEFEIGEGFADEAISTLPAILLKPDVLGVGKPLTGAAATIADNDFLYALTALEEDDATNIERLSTLDWIDLPLVYATSRRAVLTLGMGTEGRALFDDAIASWTGGE